MEITGQSDIGNNMEQEKYFITDDRSNTFQVTKEFYDTYHSIKSKAIDFSLVNAFEEFNNKYREPIKKSLIALITQCDELAREVNLFIGLDTTKLTHKNKLSVATFGLRARVLKENYNKLLPIFNLSAIILGSNKSEAVEIVTEVLDKADELFEKIKNDLKIPSGQGKHYDIILSNDFIIKEKK